MQLRKENNLIIQELQHMQEDILSLQTTIKHYETSAFYQEKIAREQLHMARAADMIIYLPEGN